MQTTVDETRDRDRECLALAIAFHRDPTLLGRMFQPPQRGEVDLGRDSDAFGREALDDPRISRRHCRIEIDAAGAMTATDLGSRNGTHLNGATFGRALLAPGDTLRFGGVVLIVAPASSEPRNTHVCREPAASGVSIAARTLRDELERALALRVPTLLTGEPGSGLHEIAAEYAARAGSVAAHVSVDGWAERLPASWLELATSDGHAALLTRGLPAAASPAEQSLREVLARVGGHGPNLWHVLTATTAPGAAESFAGRAATLGLRHVIVPPLRSRPEDIAFVAALHAAARGAAWPILGAREWATLLRETWHGNVAQLRAFADLAAASPRARKPQPEDVARWLRESATQAQAADGRATSAVMRPSTDANTRVNVARDGSWFVLPSTGRVALHRKPVLARLLAALVRVRHERPSAVVRPAALLAAVWPGERFVDGSGDNRLRVALSALRQLGLRESLERVEDGYRISPAVELEIVD